MNTEYIISDLSKDFKQTDFRREHRIILNASQHEITDIAFSNNGYLAGGCIRSIFTGESIKDFDFFFKSKEDFDATTETLSQLEGDNGFKYSFTITDNAWTYKDPNTKQIFQLICANFSDALPMLDTFDFTICMAAYKPFNEALNSQPCFVFHKNFLQHCSQRRLVFNIQAQYPICSLWRSFKFMKRGYALPAIEMIKICLCINKIDFKDSTILKKQLLGIDTLFLKELTDAIANNNHDKKFDFQETIDLLEKFGELGTINEVID